MLKKILRAGAWLAATLVVLAAAGYVYYLGFGLERQPRANPQARPADLAWLKAGMPAARGRILVVVSSASHFPDGRKKAGYELTELARAYYVFQANGFEVDIASPAGGRPPERIDQDDMGDADYAFLNDPAAQAKVGATLPLASVDPARYEAVFFIGGKGAMLDFPGNPEIARIASAIAERGVVGAVCHGPAALLHVRRADGTNLVAGRRMTGFTNEEELFLNKKARQHLPFLLEDRAREQGARFAAAAKYTGHVVVDGKLVTGQNPWSTWAAAEAVVAAMGHTPLARPETLEERSVRALAAYYADGLEAARKELPQGQGFDKMLVLMHAVVAGMQGRLADAFQLQRLARG